MLPPARLLAMFHLEVMALLIDEEEKSEQEGYL
jgi:hypothetical protein